MTEALERERLGRMLTDGQSRATRDFSEFQNALEDDRDFATMETRLNAFAERWEAENLRGAPAPVVRSLKPKIDEIKRLTGSVVRDRARRRQITESRTALDESMTRTVEQYGRTRHPLYREMLADAADAEIRQRVLSGVLNEDDGRARGEALRAELATIDARDALADDPKQFLEDLDDTAAYPFLAGDARANWKAHAKRQIAARRQQEAEDRAQTELSAGLAQRRDNERAYAELARKIESGRADRTDIEQAFLLGEITWTQRTALLAQLEATQVRRARENNGLIRVLDALRLEGEPLDPDAEDDRDAAELYWQTSVLPDVTTADPGTQRARVVEFARATGVTPDSVQKQLTAQLRSPNATQVASAASLAVELERDGLLPEGVLTSEQRAFAADTAELVEGGLSPADAVTVAKEEAARAKVAADRGSGSPAASSGFSFGDADFLPDAEIAGVTVPGADLAAAFQAFQDRIAGMTPEQRRDAALSLGQSVLEILPITGEILSVVDAYHAFTGAAEALRDGDLEQALLQGGKGALAALFALPGIGIGARLTKKAAEAAGALVRWFRKVKRDIDDFGPPGSPELALPGGGSVSGRDMDRPRQQRSEDNVFKSQSEGQGGGGGSRLSLRQQARNAADIPTPTYPKTHWDQLKVKYDQRYGPVFTKLAGNWHGALRQLIDARHGMVPGALHKERLGSINVHWGRAGPSERNKGEGLAKIAKWHPEVPLADLDQILRKATVKAELVDRFVLETRKFRIVLAKGWEGRPGLWLMTAHGI
ncbi:MAG: hypothetical protein QNJ92_18470 [Alphaproteobacteria bacterium]|nr:hypothetical protein [Alphaproteobacteria bacterium]